MTANLDKIELQLRELRESLGAIEQRVTALEGGHSPVEPAELWPRQEGRGLGGWAPSLVVLMGRSLLMLGVAFLLRAITDMEAVPDGIGLAAGFAYAMLVLVAADRSAAEPEGRVGAAFHAVVGAGIAFSLVFEGTTRFGLLDVGGATAAVAVAAGALLAVAVRRELATAAGAAALGGGLSLLALLRLFDQPAPVLILLALLGVALLWLSDRKGWTPWKWSAALMADLGFAIVPAGMAAGRLSITPGQATPLLLGLFVAYVFTIGLRSLVQEKRIGVFEPFQALVAGVVAFGGAWRLVGADALLPGLTALILGVAAYGIAFSPVVRADRRRNFFFFTSLGLTLIAVGSLQFLSVDQVAWVWSALGIGCALASARYERVTLSLHSTMFLLGAVLASGLGLTATAGFWMSDPASWPAVRTSYLAVILGLAISLSIPAARESASWGQLARLPRAALMLFLVWTAGGALLALVAPRYLGTGQEVDAGALATSRTALLAISALLLAWVSRYRRFPEAGWLVYPLLAVAGIRVLSQDLQAGRPVTLFISLALLGVSLMASARWLKRDEAAAPRDS